MYLLGLLIFVMIASNYGQEMADTLVTETSSTTNQQDANIDYQALYRELYGPAQKDTAEVVEPAPVEEKRRKKRGEKMGPAPGLFQDSYINGMHFSMNAASPYAVTGQLNSWYSYIDYGITLKLPTELDVEDFPLFMLFEVSTFSFENSYPEGGTFEGIATMFQVAAIGDRAGASLGIGFWDGKLGSMMEVNYRFRPTTNTFLRFGTRGVLMSNVEPLGDVWWLESRISMGLEL